jgi:methylenetetrahydrofolate dehydrogenase (NADP+) / methenyltetrahydrofolate cyclohydrolase
MENLIKGVKIRDFVIHDLAERYKEEVSRNKELNEKCGVAILRFEGDLYNFEAYKAAEDSMTVKQQAFEKLGYNIVNIANTDKIKNNVVDEEILKEEFEAIIKKLNNDKSVSAIIIQTPFPASFDYIVRSVLLEKDIDALRYPLERLFQIPATSEVICKIVRPFINSQPRITIIGAKGRIGKAVYGELMTFGFDNCIPLDFEESKDETSYAEKIKGSDIVVSAVGKIGTLNEQHLCTSHRLVVDCGYVPQRDGTKLGDVAVTARGIPQKITPVPGGICPMEMAELAERLIWKDIVRELEPGQNLESWKLETYYPDLYN